MLKKTQTAHANALGFGTSNLFTKSTNQSELMTLFQEQYRTVGKFCIDIRHLEIRHVLQGGGKRTLTAPFIVFYDLQNESSHDRGKLNFLDSPRQPLFVGRRRNSNYVKSTQDHPNNVCQSTLTTLSCSNVNVGGGGGIHMGNPVYE